MSNFLGRVAARAVGQATVAQPRVRALFAETVPTSAEGRLEVVETEIRTAVAVPNAVPEAARTESPAQTSSRGSEVDARVRPQPHRSAASFAEPVEGSHPRRRSDDPPVPLEAEVVEAATIDTVIGGQRPIEGVTTALPIPAIPASPAAPEAVPVAREEAPPAVRVHIGRLEVRANVQEPRPLTPHRQSPQHNELSLADYLRGRREAG